MARLIATDALDGARLPVARGAARLEALDPGPIVWIAAPPGDGARKRLSEALSRQTGTALARPGRMRGRAGARCLWFAPGEALFLGGDVAQLRPLESIGAVVADVSDAWAALRLSGAASRDVLARLVPLDLRARAFRQGDCARTLLRQIPVVLFRTGASRFDMLVARSFALSAHDDLCAAMARVSALG